jgi:methionyl-tRNA formyltransferase
MRIIFFGTSDFAVPSLREIIGSRHELAAIVTQPDRRKGRNLALTPPPVKKELEGSAVPVHQPEDASSGDMAGILKGYGADLFVVVEFGQILKRDILNIPAICSVNLHASLLPKHRGAAPINWSIIKGDRMTGVTTIRMTERMDAGDIIMSKGTEIKGEDTAATLRKKLSVMGAGLLADTVEAISSGKAAFTKQEESGATYAPKLKKSDGRVDWSADSRDIHNRVRGLIPWPGAYTCWGDRMVKIWASSFDEGLEPPPDDAGKVTGAGKEGIAVGTGRGVLFIKSLQLAGGKRLEAAEFLRGHRLKPGTRFE